MSELTEQARMRAGLPFDTRDSELIEAHHRCRALLAQYNRSASRDGDGRTAILGQLLGGVDAGVTDSLPPHVFAAGNPCRVIRSL